MSAVEDACNEANGVFYSTGYTAECPDITYYRTNYLWCIGQSCTFDEHFDAWVSDREGNGCSYTQGSAGVFVMFSSYQFIFVSSVIMLFLHK